MTISVFRIHLDQMFSLLVLLYLHDFIVFRDQPHGKYLSLGVLLSPGCTCDAIDDHQCVADPSGSDVFLYLHDWDLNLELHPDPDWDPDLEVYLDPHWDPNMELHSDPDWDLNLELHPDPDWDPDLEVYLDPHCDPNMELHSDPDWDLDLELHPDPDPDWDPDLEVHTGIQTWNFIQIQIGIWTCNFISELHLNTDLELHLDPKLIQLWNFIWIET